LWGAVRACMHVDRQYAVASLLFDYVKTLPIGPHRLFVATNTEEIERTFEDRSPKDLVGDQLPSSQAGREVRLRGRRFGTGIRRQADIQRPSAIASREIARPATAEVRAGLKEAQTPRNHLNFGSLPARKVVHSGGRKIRRPLRKGYVSRGFRIGCRIPSLSAMWRCKHLIYIGFLAQLGRCPSGCPSSCARDLFCGSLSHACTISTWSKPL